MFFRRVFILSALTLFLCSSMKAVEPTVFYMGAEPSIRIGLITNAASVSITTNDTSLVAVSPSETPRDLMSARVTVSARTYRPPEIENYRIEFQNIATQVEANDLANDIRENVKETAIVSVDPTTNLWKVWVGSIKETDTDADELKAKLADKGFDDAVTVTEKKTIASPDAIALSQQNRVAGNSEVRSLIKPTGSTQANMTTVLDPNLREVIVNGLSDVSRYTSLKAVAFGSKNERVNPVRLNGKAYRGKIEVFVNARGSLTVVNVVPLEDYLLGVVPAELGLPQLEAQKAQAIAARTYAVANIGGYSKQGFDMVPTVWSQVYKGVSIETKMGTQAVNETRGMIAMYDGKPIMAYFTSTCGGRTENSENIFDKAEPYLRGVECSLEGHKQFDPFLIRTNRVPAKIRDDGRLELVELTSQLAANGFVMSEHQMNDDWFEDQPTQLELNSWLGQLAGRFGKPLLSPASAMPLDIARSMAAMALPANYADTMLTDSDVNYLLSFDDGSEIPKDRRAEIAMLIREGYITLNPDMTFQPRRPFARARLLSMIGQIMKAKKWMPEMTIGSARPSVNGQLVVRVGRADRAMAVRPDVFLFREFGGKMYPVKEAALMGGESIAYQTDALGAVKFLAIKPTDSPTTAENMSPFVNWTKSMSAAAVQARLSRYVRGIGTLYDVNITKTGYSRRAVELQIIGSNGIKTLSGGKIRSALRLNEQLFVMNKRYNGSTVSSYTFTGRGWGHGVGMCQYGAFGMAKMGVKGIDIIKHYYTNADVVKAY